MLPIPAMILRVTPSSFNGSNQVVDAGRSLLNFRCQAACGATRSYPCKRGIERLLIDRSRELVQQIEGDIRFRECFR